MGPINHMMEVAAAEKNALLSELDEATKRVLNMRTAFHMLETRVAQLMKHIREAGIGFPEGFTHPGLTPEDAVVAKPVAPAAECTDNGCPIDAATV